MMGPNKVLVDMQANKELESAKNAAIASASKQEWDGEGLPPVGCECEYETNGYGIKKVRVECITMDGIAFTCLGEDPKFSGLDCINIAQAHRFRPIRSEAERKRDEAVKEFVRQLIECVDHHAMDKNQDAIVREKLYGMLPTLPGVTVID
ncbi:hypothetical protein L8P05_19060 [Enterobacter cloacae]|uniref:hypothetical protein n=1 Tax=Enterobacter cloacae TaxID=550 RepID=UPI0020052861|nr:hypothetical protein [Enterobacter cloacae]MCK7176024.1 hypothetical protein [Enterobacter cloacae]